MRIEEKPKLAKDISMRQEGWLWCNLSVTYIEGVRLRPDFMMTISCLLPFFLVHHIGRHGRK